MAGYHYLVMGIDPGSNITGFACLGSRLPQALTPRDFDILDAGVIRLSPREPHSKRISRLADIIYQILMDLKPNYCVVEKAFFGVNVHTALKLGETRGAIISATCRAGVILGEITPAEVKKKITGNGRADKEQVAFAIKALLGFDRKNLPTDVTDALAIALSFGLDKQHDKPKISKPLIQRVVEV